MSDPGQVETQFQTIATSECPFVFRNGDSLDDVVIAYETWGTLNEDRSNAILLFHAFSGSQHAAGYNPSVEGNEFWTKECQQGWWNPFIGPGKALDTDKYFIICANYLGGCYGSTGPASVNPATGLRHGSSFPNVTVNDVVRSQALLLDGLGIEKLLAVVGPSTGGLACVCFATLFPERVSLVIPIATGTRTTVLNRIILLEQILAIENDPKFQAGKYYDSGVPETGLSLARMISHKTFVHLNAIERRAGKDVVHPEDRFSWYRAHDHVESYMLHQGKKFTARFDANTYLRICEMWSRYDPVIEGDAEDLLSLFSRSREAGHQYLVFSIDEDYCFYPEEQAALVEQLKNAEVPHLFLTVHSEKGHDSFLLEPELYTPHIQVMLQNATD
ncbi:homoserine O-acetyltransferase [Verrucomicrobiales bacterium BCK34]|nr:homoserine O-acetyltransferase [Verrucomicrobiales bacterium BCK34]